MLHLGLRILLFFTITCAKRTYMHIGCFKDKRTRAISGSFVVYDPSVVIGKCFERAKHYGNYYFAVQNNRECFTSRSAGQTYAIYGSTLGCSHGRGGSWKLDVYKIFRVVTRNKPLYFKYWKSHVSEAMGNNPARQENQLADRINNILSAVYYWRHWLITVYGDTYGSNNHWQMHCPGDLTWHKLHWKRRYNIIVTSVSPSKPTYASRLKVNIGGPNQAKALWESIPRSIRNCNYPISAVVRYGITVALRTPRDRKYSQQFYMRRCEYYYVWFFKRKRRCRIIANFQAFILG